MKFKCKCSTPNPSVLVRVVAWLGDDFFYRRLFKPVEVYVRPEPCCPGAVVPDKE